MQFLLAIEFSAVRSTTIIFLLKSFSSMRVRKLWIGDKIGVVQG